MLLTYEWLFNKTKCILVLHSCLVFLCTWPSQTSGLWSTRFTVLEFILQKIQMRNSLWLFIFIPIQTACFLFGFMSGHWRGRYAIIDEMQVSPFCVETSCALGMHNETFVHALGNEIAEKHCYVTNTESRKWNYKSLPVVNVAWFMENYGCLFVLTNLGEEKIFRPIIRHCVKTRANRLFIYRELSAKLASLHHQANCFSSPEFVQTCDLSLEWLGPSPSRTNDNFRGAATTVGLCFKLSMPGVFSSSAGSFLWKVSSLKDYNTCLFFLILKHINSSNVCVKYFIVCETQSWRRRFMSIFLHCFYMYGIV